MTETKTAPPPVLELVPTSQLPVSADRSLTDLTVQIRQAHAEAMAAFAYGAAASIRAGHRLIAAKECLKKEHGHGLWQDYVALECGLTMRVAQIYMKLARQEDKLKELLAERRIGNSYLSQGAALKLLSTASNKRKRKVAKPVV